VAELLLLAPTPIILLVMMIDLILEFPSVSLYALAVLLLVLWAYIKGTPAQRATVSALFLLWFVNIVYIAYSGDRTNELMFGTGDALAGWFILKTAKGNKWQRSVGSWFIPMMVAHIAYWATEPQTIVVQTNYWLSFTILGWAQLATCCGWFISDLVVDFQTRNRLMAFSRTRNARYPVRGK